MDHYQLVEPVLVLRARYIPTRAGLRIQDSGDWWSALVDSGVSGPKKKAEGTLLLRNGSVESDQQRFETRIGSERFQSRIDADEGEADCMFALS